MLEEPKLIVSHAPFWHNGDSVPRRNFFTVMASLPAVIFGVVIYGLPAVAVVCFSIAMAVFWEHLANRLLKRRDTVGDGDAVVIGLMLAMLMPATTPWWIVLVGTFIAVIIGKMLYGGIGANPFHPTALAMAILMISWKNHFDFNEALRNYNLGFPLMVYPLDALKHAGTSAVARLGITDMLLGRQIGGIGATFGLGIIAGGIYLMARGYARWEITAAFLGGVFVTALIFHTVDPAKYGGPAIHLLSGYTLIGAFFLLNEPSSSPVNPLPMVICGATGGIMTVLMRTIGAHIDGVILSILLVNMINPLVDKIRPNALGKVV